jgi:poly(A) polymerase
MSIVGNATSIVKTLKEHGFTAYFAGGYVRDLIMGRHSFDVDIATNATPDDIAKIFPRTLLVGAKFGVAIVMQKGHHYEIATFRKDENYQDGRHPENIIFSDAQDDAQRRDFTINGMFFDPLDNIVLDFVGGKEDLNKKIIRAIGDPAERFSEDKLRMLRAVRFAYRFDFVIEDSTKDAIYKHSSSLLPSVSVERVLQEFDKMSKEPSFHLALISMFELQLLQTIFPELKKIDLDELKRRVDPLKDYPSDTDTFLKLTQLFNDKSLEDLLEIGRFLKTTNESLKTIEYYHEAKKYFLNPETVSLWQWAHIYCHPRFHMILHVFQAHLELHLRKTFISDHETRYEYLKEDIKRIQSKIPVVNSSHLKEKGIKPGPLMGKLLKEAEQISINERLHHYEDVIKRLQF